MLSYEVEAALLVILLIAAIGELVYVVRADQCRTQHKGRK